MIVMVWFYIKINRLGFHPTPTVGTFGVLAQRSSVVVPIRKQNSFFQCFRYEEHHGSNTNRLSTLVLLSIEVSVVK